MFIQILFSIPNDISFIFGLNKESLVIVILSLIDSATSLSTVPLIILTEPFPLLLKGEPIAI